MGKRILGEKQAQVDVPATVPVGAVGIDMTTYHDAARPRWWMISIEVISAPSDVFLWGAIPEGTADDTTDDVWGLYQDEFATFPLGKIATVLPVGIHHFQTDGLGLFSRVYFQKSAGTVNVKIWAISDAHVGS